MEKITVGILLSLFLIGSPARAYITAELCEKQIIQMNRWVVDCARDYDGLYEEFYFCKNRYFSAKPNDLRRVISKFTMIVLDDKCREDAMSTLYQTCLSWEDNSSLSPESYCSWAKSLKTNPRVKKIASDIYFDR